MNTKSMPSVDSVAIIGAGAAGLYAAACLSEAGVSVTLIEHKADTGKKLLITGKGRCNVTNNCTPEEFLQQVPRNPRFLMGALHKTTPQDVMAFFEAHGVPLKTERGRRVFPVSDKAKDIVAALRDATRRCVHVRGHAYRIEAVQAEGVTSVTGVHVQRHDGSSLFCPAAAVLIATGGMSYPLTGSDGSGYGLATALGHSVTHLSPSLVPLECADPLCSALQGVAPKNIAFSLCRRQDGKPIFTDFGEMLFTHFGISGPVVLSASAHLRGQNMASLDAVIDWKPALDEKTLDARLLSDFAKYANRELTNAMSDLLPARVIPVCLSLAQVDPCKRANALTKEERRRILQTLKHFALPLRRCRPIEEAVITSGGIDVKEVSPKTMMSKLAQGLFFAGEILDVDAYTGGYNLQIAFCTAASAAAGMADYIQALPH